MGSGILVSLSVDTCKFGGINRFKVNLGAVVQALGLYTFTDY